LKQYKLKGGGIFPFSLNGWSDGWGGGKGQFPQWLAQESGEGNRVGVKVGLFLQGEKIITPWKTREDEGTKQRKGERDRGDFIRKKKKYFYSEHGGRKGEPGGETWGDKEKKIHTKN